MHQSIKCLVGIHNYKRKNKLIKQCKCGVQVMTETLKSNEALSNGHIFNKEQKEKERQTIQEQIDAFFKSGGKIDKK